MTDRLATRQRLRFLRHGATELNLAGLRCGGDVDVPLTDVGRAQAAAAAHCIANLRPAVGVIVTSQLLRTRQTADIIVNILRARPREGMPGGEVADICIVIEPLLAERRLGEWNGLSRQATQAWFDAGHTPPGGESKAAFKARVQAGLHQLRGLWRQQPLLISSQGVARVLGELGESTGQPHGVRVANAQLLEFDIDTHALVAERAALMEEML
jgi:2,3-bisphosphoglycerate-dependent phosphoglycerate mutase